MSSTITALTSGGGLAMAGDTSGQLELKTNNGTTAVTIGTDQRIGIGTTTLSQKVVVGGEVNTRVQVDGTSTGGVFFTVNGSDAGTIRGNSTGDMEFLVNGSTGFFRTNGNFQFNSGYGSAATAYGCRAWVNFNGTGTVAIRASGNVSSITDNGTGDYTVNFTTAMPDANYSSNLSASREPSSGGGAFCQNIATNDATGGNVAPTTSAIRVATNGGAGLGGRDVTYISVAIFR